MPWIKVKFLGHDLEEFARVVRRHGLWRDTDEERDLAEALARAVQLELLPSPSRVA